LKKLLLLLLIPVAALVWWAIARKNEPPRVNFARVERATLVSTLPTNGKVEPFDWREVRADATGQVTSVSVQEGLAVAKGATLAVIANPELQAAGRAAEARVAEARAALTGLEAGRPSDVAEIENSLARARFDREQAQREIATLQRLIEKQAATPMELQAAQAKVQQADLEIVALERRRGALVSKPDVAAAQARLRDAESALQLAREQAAESVVKAPIAGTIYQLAARPGAFVEPGTAVASVGTLDRLHVHVYVDEPELGRVQEGQPVTITWDALPGRQWKGTVERKPAAVEALGSRQVGDVLCTIENPGRELIPGTNVNAEIRTAVAENALVIPKEALRRDAHGAYVLVLRNGAVERKPVETGISSVAQVQVTSGLAAGDSVALPGEAPLTPGERVTPAQ
jgi:HlyD family secretion protein